jgi:hypothetical protein
MAPPDRPIKAAEARLDRDGRTAPPAIARLKHGPATDEAPPPNNRPLKGTLRAG